MLKIPTEREIQARRNRVTVWNTLLSLTLVFTILKTFEIIDWEWEWVMSPLWMPFALALLVVSVAFVVGFIRGMLNFFIK